MIILLFCWIAAATHLQSCYEQLNCNLSMNKQGAISRKAAFCFSATVLWLFSLASDAVKVTLKVGFNYPFVVIDPTYFGVTIVVAQALCLTIFNLFPTRNTFLYPDTLRCPTWAHRYTANIISCAYSPTKTAIIQQVHSCISSQSISSTPLSGS